MLIPLRYCLFLLSYVCCLCALNMFMCLSNEFCSELSQL